MLYGFADLESHEWKVFDSEQVSHAKALQYARDNYEYDVNVVVFVCNGRVESIPHDDESVELCVVKTDGIAMRERVMPVPNDAKQIDAFPVSMHDCIAHAARMSDAASNIVVHLCDAVHDASCKNTALVAIEMLQAQLRVLRSMVER